MNKSRKYNLAKIGAVLIAMAGVASIVWPEKTEQMTQLATALAGLLAAIAAAIGWEDGQQARAKADVESASLYAAAATKEEGC